MLEQGLTFAILLFTEQSTRGSCRYLGPFPTPKMTWSRLLLSPKPTNSIPHGLCSGMYRHSVWILPPQSDFLGF